MKPEDMITMLNVAIDEQRAMVAPAFLSSVRDYIQNSQTALAELYVVLGAHDASEKALDNCIAALDGEPLPHGDLVPYILPPPQGDGDA